MYFSLQNFHKVYKIKIKYSYIILVSQINLPKKIFWIIRWSFTTHQATGPQQLANVINVAACIGSLGTVTKLTALTNFHATFINASQKLKQISTFTVLVYHQHLAVQWRMIIHTNQSVYLVTNLAVIRNAGFQSPQIPKEFS